MSSRQITDPKELVDWLADQVLRTEPQANMSAALVGVFCEIVSQLGEYGVLEPAGFGHDAFIDLLYTIARPAGTVMCNEYLPMLIGDIYEYFFSRKKPTDAAAFVKLALSAANMDKHITCRWVGSKWLVNSHPGAVLPGDVTISVQLTKPALDH